MRPEATGELQRRGSLLHHAGHDAASRSTSAAPEVNFQIVIEETGELLGTVDGARVRAGPPRAVYLHQGEQFEVQLDLSANVAIVAGPTPTTTRSRATPPTSTSCSSRRRPLSGETETSFGTVRVTNQVVAYARKHVATGEVLKSSRSSFRPCCSRPARRGGGSRKP